MSDPAIALENPAAGPVETTEDRVLPAAVYVLYLLGPTNGLTLLIGLVLAYAQEAGAGPKMKSHYAFQIRTFWMAIGWFLIGLALFAVGLPLSLLLVGVPALVLGGMIMGLVGVWFTIRCVLGLVHLAKDEAYPRPRTWLA